MPPQEAVLSPVEVAVAVDSRLADSLDHGPEYNKEMVDSITEEADSREETTKEDSMEIKEEVDSISHDQITISTIIREDSIQIQIKDSMEIRDSIMEDSVQEPVSAHKHPLEHSRRLLSVELSEQLEESWPMKPERPSSSRPPSHSIIMEEIIIGIIMDKPDLERCSAQCH